MPGLGDIERRKSSRYSVSEDGNLALKVERHGSVLMPAELASLSVQGARFCMGAAIPLSEVVLLQLEVPSLDISLDIRSTIIWSQPASDGRWTVGCSFDRAIPNDIVERLALAGLVDRRAHERFPVDVPGIVRWQASGARSSATLTDYSVGGFCLECDTLNAVGDHVQVEFNSGEVVAGIVKWNSKAGTKFLHGCDFVPVYQKDKSGANMLGRLSAESRECESTGSTGPRKHVKAGTFEWVFAIACMIACAFSIWQLLRTFNTGSLHARAFSIAYASTTVLCLLGSALPFVVCKADESPCSIEPPES